VRSAPGLLTPKAIKWNFTKFFDRPQWPIIERYAPMDKPEHGQGHQAALAALRPDFDYF
jgi:glutathione peroxidase-family protein